MLKVLDFTRTQIGVITDYTDLEIVHSLEDGDEQISFTYLGDVPLQNEYYVQTDKARYTIKEYDPDDTEVTYHGLLDLEDLQRTPFKQFTSTGQTIEAAAAAVLSGTGWTVVSDVTGTRNVQRFKKTPLELLYALRDAWMCEIRFDNLNKVVYFSEEFGEDKGVYLMRGLNLKKVSPSIESYDYVTRIIPYGADGLTIEEVNQGIPYVENYQYSTKILTLIWEDTSYEDALTLKIDAAKKEATIAGTDIVIREGDMISLDGTTGIVVLGAVDLVQPELTGDTFQDRGLAGTVGTCQSHDLPPADSYFNAVDLGFSVVADCRVFHSEI